eukprot:scaffold4545_cov58-Phaeocystis_antarctica.AAC.7
MRALEGEPSTPVDDTLVDFADNLLDICQLFIEELEAPHARVFQCSGLVRDVAQEFLRVSSYPILIVIVLVEVTDSKSLKGAAEIGTVDAVHIVTERGRGTALHADNNICATFLPTNTVLCALIHEGGPRVTRITAALAKRELHQGVALNVADVMALGACGRRR